MDSKLLVDLNDLARHGDALNDIVRGYAEIACFVLLLCCLAVVANASRKGGIGHDSGPSGMGLLVALICGPLAYGIARVAEPIVGRSAPAAAGIRLLVLFSDGSHTLPDPLTAAAFGVASALLLLGGRRIAVVVLLLAALEAFAVVVAGAARPSDVGVGAAVGVLVAAILIGLHAWLTGRATRTAPAGAHHLVGGVQNGHNAVDGPAAHPAPDEATGAVRILSATEIRPASSGSSGATRPGVTSS